MLLWPSQSWIKCHAHILHHLLSFYPNRWNIPHSLIVFYLYHRVHSKWNWKFWLCLWISYILVPCSGI
jgi:hypothetical protein